MGIWQGNYSWDLGWDLIKQLSSVGKQGAVKPDSGLSIKVGGKGKKFAVMITLLKTNVQPIAIGTFVVQSITAWRLPTSDNRDRVIKLPQLHDNKKLQGLRRKFDRRGDGLVFAFIRSAILCLHSDSNPREFGLSRTEQVVIHGDSWLFGLMAISNQPTENINKTVNGGTMSGMLNLRNIL